MGEDVASDMLTRLTATDDMAPDVNVLPVSRDANTGGRQIEPLAFEVVSTERLAESGCKADKLVARGVQRVRIVAGAAAVPVHDAARFLIRRTELRFEGCLVRCERRALWAREE